LTEKAALIEQIERRFNIGDSIGLCQAPYSKFGLKSGEPQPTVGWFDNNIVEPETKVDADTVY
jgi:hypothetical protein